MTELPLWTSFVALLPLFLHCVQTPDRHPEEFSLLSASGNGVVQAEEQFVDISYRNGDVRGAVVVFYHPQTQLSCWLFGLAGGGPAPGILDSYRDGSLLYLTNEELVFFTTLNRDLIIRRCRDRAPSLDAALRRAGSAVESRKADFLKPDMAGAWKLFTVIDLSSSLGADFFVKGGSAAPPTPPHVISISVDNETWNVTLRGPNGDRAIITLNASFELQAARRSR